MDPPVASITGQLYSHTSLQDTRTGSFSQEKEMQAGKFNQIRDRLNLPQMLLKLDHVYAYIDLRLHF